MKISNSQVPQVQMQQTTGTAKANNTANKTTKTAAVTQNDASFLEQNVQSLNEAADYVLPDGYDNLDDYLKDVNANTAKAQAAAGTDTGASKQKQPPEYQGGIGGLWVGDEKYGFWSKKDEVYYSWTQEMNGDFYQQAFEFFRDPNDDASYWDNYAQFSSSLDAAKQELADQIAAGKGDSLDTLTSKVKIAPGVEMTLSEINQVYDVCKKTSDGIKEYWRGSGGVAGHEIVPLYTTAAVAAKKGLADAGLSQEIVDFAGGVFHDRCMQFVSNSNKSSSSSAARVTFDPAVHTGEKYYDYYYSQVNYDINDENSISHDVYKKLTGIDTSSDESFEKGFAEFYQWFFDSMTHLQQRWWGYGNGESRSAFLLELKDLLF